jgi:hypothetical protein
MLQILIAIILGLTSPSTQTTTSPDGTIVTANTSGEDDGTGTGGSGTTGNETGQIPPPPLNGGN